MFDILIWLYVAVRLPVWLHLLKDSSQNFVHAKFLLDSECNGILSPFEPNNYLHFCTNPMFEATRLNLPMVVIRVKKRFPNPIQSVNEDGHNIIQHSVISRSEKIYNLLYNMSPYYNIYRTLKDSSCNNLIHLATRLSPFRKLNQIRGATLQFQHDLHWFNVRFYS